MQYTAEELLKKVNEALASLPYDRQPASLYEPVKYVLSLGGKRLRPVLMLLAYQLYKDDPERIMMPAIGLETYHNFTLLHDDLMDNADMRRGHDTVHRRWNANKAILSGDTMLVLAFQRMQQCQPRHLQAVLDVFTQTALQIDEGQELDMDFETRNDVAEEEYIEMIRLKTSVLLGCAMKVGALLADAPDADVESLYKFGEQLGLAFQLQDDLLDVYGDPAVFGKAIGGDIMCGKKTFMLINALNRADEAQRGELLRWLDDKDAPRQQKVEAVTALYNQLGIRRLCEERISFYFNECLSSLAKVAVSDERKQQLLHFTNQMMKRDR